MEIEKNTKQLSEEEKEHLLLLDRLEEDDKITQSREKYRKVTQAAIAQWVKDLKNGSIVIESVSDFERLVKLDLYLQSDEI